MTIPSAADAVRLFRDALTTDATASTDEWHALLLQLHRNNLVQWRREDATRAPDADDAVVAAAKRDIDGLNASRHGLIEAIDARLDAALDQDPSAVPATETPGMVLDRLSVLVIRTHITERAADESADGGDRFRARLPVLETQLALLEQALEGLFDDVRRRRKRFVPYQSLKLYGGPPPEARSSSRAGSRRD
jgi:Protein of unknown function (DUF4254)